MYYYKSFNITFYFFITSEIDLFPKERMKLLVTLTLCSQEVKQLFPYYLMMMLSLYFPLLLTRKAALGMKCLSLIHNGLEGMDITGSP